MPNLALPSRSPLLGSRKALRETSPSPPTRTSSASPLPSPTVAGPSSLLRSPPKPIASGKELSEQYELLEKIGAGSFGTVYKAMHKQTRQIVAINSLASDCSNLIAGVPICLPPVTCTTYTVQSGDSCSSIVSSEQMQSVTQLLGINPGLFCQGLLSSELICVTPPGT